jgi:signal transduction histidine kinase
MSQVRPKFARRLPIDLREANEKLLLAALESERLKDLAEAAQAAAELATLALRKSERELLANAEFRERLLAIVGHDLKNPLSAIAMSARLMLNPHRLDPADARLAGMIQRCAKRMGLMIEQVLDFTRLRVGGGLHIEREPADLRVVCEQAIGELAVGVGARIAAQFDGGLTGRWDAERLTQVMSNLLGNAVDHADSGTSVRLAARGTGTEVIIEIKNQGAAIPADLVPLLFAPFRGGRTAKDGHLGLGLYIAHEIVGLHHGTLSARCELGVTTFSLRLPRSG